LASEPGSAVSDWYVLRYTSPTRWRLERKDELAPYEEVEINPGDMKLIEAPPGIAHAITNTGNSTLAIVDLSDLTYDPDVADDFDNGVWPDLCEGPTATIC